jgi:hypothetical protein
VALSEDDWTVLRALKTGGPPHSERALATATGIDEAALRHALEALANVVPPLAQSAVDVRLGERRWSATTAADDALDATDPRGRDPREPPALY